jgi:hypothetical protein
MLTAEEGRGKQIVGAVARPEPEMNTGPARLGSAAWLRSFLFGPREFHFSARRKKSGPVHAEPASSRIPQKLWNKFRTRQIQNAIISERN